jgi:hypothetical protein
MPRKWPEAKRKKIFYDNILIAFSSLYSIQKQIKENNF